MFELIRTKKPAPQPATFRATDLKPGQLFRPPGWDATSVFLRCRDGAVRFSQTWPPLVYTEQELTMTLSCDFNHVYLLDATYKFTVNESY